MDTYLAYNNANNLRSALLAVGGSSKELKPSLDRADDSYGQKLEGAPAPDVQVPARGGDTPGLPLAVLATGTGASLKSIPGRSQAQSNAAYPGGSCALPVMSSKVSAH